MGYDYDVAVVGAGSSGCVVARWLTETRRISVCLVEAGPDYGKSKGGRWPPELLDPRRKPRTHDWGYSWEGPDGQNVPEARSRVVGGCSTHNQCAAIWGLPSDYDIWAKSGCLGWSYQELRPLIDQLEDELASATRYHGRGGALPTRPYSDGELASWQRLFIESALTAGFPQIADLSSPTPPEGVAAFHANVKDNVRYNAAFAFLDAVREYSNLTILSNTLADRMIIREGRAESLVCHSNGGISELQSKSYVLCTGTYGSPAILMRSGVGPPAHLEEMRIRVQKPSEGVGANLHDHPGISLRYEPRSVARDSFEEDVRQGKYHESQVILRGKSKYHNVEFDLHILPFQDLTDLSTPSWGVLVFNLRPLSRGRVLLRGKDPVLLPRIEFRLLTDAADLDASVLIDGISLARRLARLRPLSEAVLLEKEPGNSVQTDSDLRTYLGDHARTYAHPVGTCKMGPSNDPTAVVSTDGKVRGSTNIFVADASVIPQIPKANTNLTCLLIGRKIADSIIRLN